MSRFLDEVHIVEALNDPVDDSVSEGYVSETECSPWCEYYNILIILMIVFKCMSKMPGFLNLVKH